MVVGCAFWGSSKCVAFMPLLSFYLCGSYYIETIELKVSIFHINTFLEQRI